MANNWSFTWRASGSNMANAQTRTLTPTAPALLENYRRITAIVRRNGVYCKTGGTSQTVDIQGYDELIDASTGTVIKQSATGACRVYGSGPSSSDYLTTTFSDITVQESRAILAAWSAGTLQIRRTVWIQSYTSDGHGQPYFRSGYYHDDIAFAGTDSAYQPVVTVAAFSAADESRLYAESWSEPPFDFTVKTTVASSDYWEDPAKLHRRLEITAENLTGNSPAMESIVLNNSGVDSTTWTVTQDDVSFVRSTDGFLRGSRYRITFALSVGVDADNLTETASAWVEIDVAATPFHMSRRGNGVAVGKYSAVGSDESEKLFECAFPARFYENVEGVADYSEAAVPVAGTWLDGKRIYRVVIPFDAAAGTTEIAVLEDMDALVRMDGSVMWDGGYRLPVTHYLGSNNFHQVFFADKTLVFQSANAASGHIIIDYTKTTEEAN